MLVIFELQLVLPVADARVWLVFFKFLRFGSWYRSDNDCSKTIKRKIARAPGVITGFKKV